MGDLQNICKHLAIIAGVSCYKVKHSTAHPTLDQLSVRQLLCEGSALQYLHWLQLVSWEVSGVD